MAAFNVVRFKVKAGREQEFLDAHKGIGRRGQVSGMPTSSRPAIGPTASSQNGMGPKRSLTPGPR